MIGTPATLEQILANKERRFHKQQELLKRFSSSFLISLSINIPSAIKLSHESLVIFKSAYEAILKLLKQTDIELLLVDSYQHITGVEALWVCKGDAKSLKIATCKLEEEHPLGRLMDIDVFEVTGTLLSRTQFGFTKRRCLLCDEQAIICAKERRHSYEALNSHIKALVHEHAFDDSIALWCERAMQKEVELTPKPGLVDRANTGAHADMNIATFYASIKAIKPFIVDFLRVKPVTFDALRRIGMLCEEAMFRATNGVNTHKGMIFCLALSCGAVAKIKQAQQPLTRHAIQQEIKALSHGLVEKDLQLAKPDSAGARFFYETGSLGIRGEAQSGFALVFEGSLPFFESQKALFGEDKALKMTLLWLMTRLEDSTLWSRGGMEGLTYVKQKAEKILACVIQKPEALEAYLWAFDEDLTQQHLSPGGSADLLALTWLFAHLKTVNL